MEWAMGTGISYEYWADYTQSGGAAPKATVESVAVRERASPDSEWALRTVSPGPKLRIRCGENAVQCGLTWLGFNGMHTARSRSRRFREEGRLFSIQKK